MHTSQHTFVEKVTHTHVPPAANAGEANSSPLTEYLMAKVLLPFVSAQSCKSAGGGKRSRKEGQKTNLRSDVFTVSR